MKKKRKEGKKRGDSQSKEIEMFENGISLGLFHSSAELEKQSEKLFGITLHASGILRVCHKNQKEYKGFTFNFT